MTPTEFVAFAAALREAGALVVEGPGGYKAVFGPLKPVATPPRAPDEAPQEAVDPIEAKRRLRARMLGG